MVFSPTPLATRRRSPASESVGDAASEREVRTTDTIDFVVVNANAPRCLTCRKDRQKCIRKDPNKCDRCIDLGYNCTIDDTNAPADGKRRKLQRLKCEACRSAKVKCEPTGRQWPDKCTRCGERNLPCSEPQQSNKKKIQADGRTAATPRSIEESDDESDTDPSTILGGRGLVDSRRPARAPVNDAPRPISRPQRSMSDIVYDAHPHLASSRPPPRNTYIYQPLKQDEIRLLLVQPGLPGQDIVCVILTERLQNCPPYQALSYRWGDDTPDKPVTVITYKQSPAKPKYTIRKLKLPKLYTRSNLYEALQQLRDPEKVKPIYATALCIDHDDQAEKYTQASRTQEIFNTASDVIVWLGTVTPASQMAFKFIPKVLDMNGFDKLIKEESNTNNQCWDALAELMRNPLFSRRWLIQELAVAKIAALHCGKYTIPWTDFSDAVALFEANLPEIQKYFKFSQASGGPINDIRALGASTLVSVVNNMLCKRPNGQIKNRLNSVETLVSILAVFEAANPLDTIFAVVGLAKDRQEVRNILSGERGILYNFIAFVSHCVQSSGNIDIICRHWAPIIGEKVSSPGFEQSLGTESTKVQLPSWIPNVSGSAFGAPEDKDKGKQSGRVHGDSFVGLPNHCIYNASSGFPPSNFKFGQYSLSSQPYPNMTTIPEYPQYDGTMIVQGYSLGPIAEVGPRAVKGIIQEECLEMGGWAPNSPSVPERLWRTLVADRGPNNTKPPSWYHRACLHCLAQIGTNGDIDTGALLKQPKCSHIVADFLRRVQSVIWNRRFFLSKDEFNSDRLFGLAPGGTRSGDLICILYGCSVPVILREYVTPEDHYYEVIGECFVYGMMDGEAREGLTDEEVVERTMTFKLR